MLGCSWRLMARTVAARELVFGANSTGSPDFAAHAAAGIANASSHRGDQRGGEGSPATWVWKVSIDSASANASRPDTDVVRRLLGRGDVAHASAWAP